MVEKKVGDGKGGPKERGEGGREGSRWVGWERAKGKEQKEGEMKEKGANKREREGIEMTELCRTETITLYFPRLFPYILIG